MPFSSHVSHSNGTLPSNPIEIPLGDVLKRLRIPRSALADSMEVSVQTVNNWCSGRVRIPVHRLSQVSGFLEEHGASQLQIALIISAELRSHGLTTPAYVQPLSDRQPPIMVLAWDLMRADFSSFPYVARLTRQALERLGFRTILVDCEGTPALRSHYLNWAVDIGCAGIALVGVISDPSDPKHELLATIETITKGGTAVVVVHLGQEWGALPERTATIGWDTAAVDALAIDVLTQAGHRDLGFLLSSRASLAMGSHRGLPAAMHSHGLEFQDGWTIWRADTPQTEIERQFEQIRGQVTALYVDAVQLRTFTKVATHSGLQWPEDISVITCGFGRSVPVLGKRPLTHVEEPAEQVSVDAAKLLAALLEDAEQQSASRSVLYGRSRLQVRHLDDGSIGPPGACRRDDIQDRTNSTDVMSVVQPTG